MKKSELRQMIREEYHRATVNEAVAKRAKQMLALRKEMVKHLNAFDRAHSKLDGYIELRDEKVIRKLEMIEKRVNDIFEYLGDVEDLLQQIEED